jgi:hypothetical protein
MWNEIGIKVVFESSVCDPVTARYLTTKIVRICSRCQQVTTAAKLVKISRSTKRQNLVFIKNSLLRMIYLNLFNLRI